jgi:hypothetical protein
MSLSAIDAMLRERRLAAMRAEIEQSLDASSLEGQPSRGYDSSQLPESNPDVASWTGTGVAPGAELAAAAVPYTFPMSDPTMNVAMRGCRPGYGRAQVYRCHSRPTLGSHGSEIRSKASRA